MHLSVHTHSQDHEDTVEIKEEYVPKAPGAEKGPSCVCPT